VLDIWHKRCIDRTRKIKKQKIKLQQIKKITKMKNSILAFVFLLIFVGAVSAADTNTDNHKITIGIPNIALLDIEPDNDGFDMDVTQAVSNEAGNPLDFEVTNATKWLNYTSVVNQGQTRRITAQITEGALPSGVSLKVQAATSTTGKGTLGTTTGIKTLLTSGTVDVITGIGSCFTQNGANKGSLLSYSIEMDDENSSSWANLVATDYEVTITYTITEN
jgi:hypothetical protein